MLLHILHIVNSASVYITHANCSHNYKQITHQILSLHLPYAKTLHMSDSRFCQLWQMLAAHAFSFCKGQVLACNGCAANVSPCPKWYRGRWEPHKVAQISWNLVIVPPNFGCWLVGKTWRNLRFWSHDPHRWAFSRLSSVVALCCPTCWNLAREAHRWPPKWFKPKAVKSTNIPKWTAHLETHTKFA